MTITGCNVMKKDTFSLSSFPNFLRHSLAGSQACHCLETGNGNAKVQIKDSFPSSTRAHESEAKKRVDRPYVWGGVGGRGEGWGRLSNMAEWATIARPTRNHTKLSLNKLYSNKSVHNCCMGSLWLNVKIVPSLVMHSYLSRRLLTLTRMSSYRVQHDANAKEFYIALGNGTVPQ